MIDQYISKFFLIVILVIFNFINLKTEKKSRASNKTTHEIFITAFGTENYTVLRRETL